MGPDCVSAVVCVEWMPESFAAANARTRGEQTPPRAMSTARQTIATFERSRLPIGRNLAVTSYRVKTKLIQLLGGAKAPPYKLPSRCCKRQRPGCCLAGLKP